jgi:hypothetical protein
LHVGGGFSQKRGLEKGASFGVAMSAKNDPRTFGGGIGEQGLDFFKRGGVDERALGDPRFKTIANFQF